MYRRDFLQLGICAAAAATIEHRAWADSSTVKIRVREDKVLNAIPADFIGLGYEASSVSTPLLLSAKNHKYVQLVRTLGTSGIIRVGGNNSDYARFDPHGTSSSLPKASVITERNLRDLKGFLDATGWRLIWGLNLGSGAVDQAVAEAEAVHKTMKDKLLAFEIGNEPDLYIHEGHRKGTYSYDDYLADFRRYQQAIRTKIKDAPFAGPDAADSNDWVARFAQDEGHDLKLLTEHYYRGGAGSPSSTLEELFHPDLRLEMRLSSLHQASQSSHVPFRICETNSFSGGGKPGVSDTFGAALWTLDYMFRVAAYGASGVNIETGENQFGVISDYSPIGDDQHGGYTAKPAYYGMLAFSQAAEGSLVIVDSGTAGINLTSYAVRHSDGRLVVAIINKDPSKDASIELTTTGQFAKAEVMRLIAPSLSSKDGVTLGGAELDPTGRWSPKSSETARIANGKCQIHAAAGSAALVTLTA